MNKYFLTIIGWTLLACTKITTGVISPTCGPNEVFEKCKLPCPETCETIFQNNMTPLCLPPNPCPPGCNCMSGYVRDEFNVCIKKDNCQTPNCPGIDEVFVKCKNPCPDTCNSIMGMGPKRPCITIIPCPCGCQCREGYVRNSLKVCIKKELCPSPNCIKPNETYYTCKNPCPETCTSIYSNGPQILCLPPFPCPGGCDCLAGYVRNNNGVCIKKEDCPTPTCPANEVYVSCKNPCPETCSSIYDPLPRPICDPIFPCPGGCQCINGYVRNSENICVKKESCPKPTCPGPNECWVPCKDTCPKTCATVMNLVPPPPCPPPPSPCPAGCECLPGFVRNDNNICIKIDDCPKPICNGGNETYSTCLNLCRDTCAYIIEPHSKKPTCVNPTPCRSGCDCLPNYYRLSNNQCVKKEDCFLSCGRNEVLVPCKGFCTFDEDCPFVMNDIVPIYIIECPPPPLIPQCLPVCRCQTGFVRIGTECVTTNECCANPSTEQLVSCSHTCEETCDGIPATCPPVQCYKKKCHCKPGLVRNTNGVCIPKSQCPLSCKPNEVFNPCPAYCTFDQDCLSYMKGIIRDCAAPPPYYTCTQRCDCKPGYLRIGGDCSLPDHCCKNPNTEVVVDCPHSCEETCVGPPASGCQIEPCPIRTCICKPGLVRNPNGDCIPKSQCSPCLGPNEVYKICGTKCEATCDNRNPVCPAVCKKGCFCIDGYVRSANGTCILIDKCPLVCKENEVLNACPGYCTFDKDCGSYIFGFIRDCPPPPPDYECQQRCDCKPGYVRTEEGCVLPIHCCKGPSNEVIVNCPHSCEETCAGPPATNCEITPCLKKVCICKPGLVRNATGYCVPKSQCPPCSGLNEVYKICGTKCEATCDNRNPVCPAVCKKGCFCIDGYVRSANGTCIPIDKCPLVCKENEVLNACPGYCTFDEDCGSYIFGFIRDCAAPPPDYECQPRCDCKEGYLRTEEGCVLPNHCCKNPSSELVVNCPHSCEETCVGQPANGCEITPCNIRTCVCKPGLVRNATGDCIPKLQCPPCSGINEEYKICGTNCEATCDNKNPVCPAVCKKGCFCINGYIRSANGTCIPIDKCPPVCKNNEVLNMCPRYCTFDEDCESYIFGFIRDCAAPPPDYECQPRCDCKEGYVRTEEGCVSPIHCCKNPSAEVIVNCPQSCEETCVGPPQNGCTITPCLKKVCICKPGMVRNSTGDCIAKSHCPPCHDPHEVYKTCGPNCQPTCDNKHPKCPTVCKKGCFCIDGYIRSINGTCIPVNLCPLRCKQNEVLNPCPAKCTFDENCSSYINGKTKVCPATASPYVCRQRCECKPGYLRINNLCVLPNQCCKNPNTENVVNCPHSCEETCDGPPAANCQKSPCVKRTCVCNAGLIRNYSGDCVAKTKCNICTGPNEVYNNCGTSCQPTCANRTPTCTKPCVKGCFCKSGYIRNKNNVCSLIANCPK